MLFKKQTKFVSAQLVYVNNIKFPLKFVGK
jgi:hypothetical protein